MHPPRDPPGPPSGGLQRLSKGLTATLVSLLFAMLALAAFAGALEARSTNAMEEVRRAELCEPDDVRDRCVSEPVAPHLVRGLALSAVALAAAGVARHVRARPPNAAGP